MENCIFCKIIAQTIPAESVYRDEQTFAFMDIKPVMPGHILLIPREHHTWFYDLPDSLSDILFRRAKKLAVALKQATDADYVQLSIVGKDVPHVHIHLMPRCFSDTLSGWDTKEYKKEEMASLAKKIRAAL